MGRTVLVFSCIWIFGRLVVHSAVVLRGVRLLAISPTVAITAPDEQFFDDDAVIPSITML